MIPRKAYIKKEMVHSPRGEEVMANITGYLIRVLRNNGENVITTDSRVQDPVTCIAALRYAKEHNARCLVFAIGWAYNEECLELVDEDFLMTKVPNGTN